tara:strand:- start:233 stop:1336 length:1104 start_codon:yes stop_codon:yes gene_type:complete
MKVSDMNSQAPVGTTLALLERNMKVMSAVQARLHASMKKEFDILVNIISDFGEPSYPYDTGEEEEIKASDFDRRIDVLPVSDPNAATMAQRIMQYQAAMQLAQTAPEMYDMKELHRQMLDVLGIQDVNDVIPEEAEIDPVDPVTAVQNLINNKPVKAFEFQDHDAHIQTVAAAQDNPEIQQLLGQSPNAPAILASASSYINDHLTMKFRKQVEEEMGIALPPVGEPIPADVEKRISDLVAEAASRVTQKAMQEAEDRRIAAEQQDPLIQMKEREVAAREAEVQRKAMGDQARFQLAAQKQQADQSIKVAELQLEKEKIESDTQIEGTKIGAKIASELLENEKVSKKQAVEDFKTGIDIAKDIVKDSN